MFDFACDFMQVQIIDFSNCHCSMINCRSNCVFPGNQIFFKVVVFAMSYLLMPCKTNYRNSVQCENCLTCVVEPAKFICGSNCCCETLRGFE